MRSYERLLILCFIVALLCLAMPSLVLITAMLFVPAIALMCAPAGFLYLLALYPSVVMSRNGYIRPVCIFLGILGAGLIGYGIPALAQAYFNYENNSFGVDDEEQKFSLKGSSVHIYYSDSDERKDRGLRPSAACEFLCQSLLRVPEIEVVYMSDSNKTTAYRLSSPDCQLHEMQGKLLITYPFARCFSEEVSQAPPQPALTVEIKPHPLFVRSYWPKIGSADLALVRLKAAYLIELGTVAEDKQRAISRVSIVDGEVASSPFFIEIDMNGGALNGTRISREQKGWQVEAFKKIWSLMDLQASHALTPN